MLLKDDFEDNDEDMNIYLQSFLWQQVNKFNKNDFVKIKHIFKLRTK